MISFLCFVLRRTETIQQVGIPFLLGCAGRIKIRLFFPYELEPAIEIYCRDFYRIISFPFNVVLFSIGEFHFQGFHCLCLIWWLVAAIRLQQFLREYLRFKTAVLLSDIPVMEKEREIMGQVLLEYYKKPAPFRLLRSDVVTTPLLMGLCKPIIVLPDTSFSREELYYIFKHEISHHYHHDLWLKSILELLCAIYWWNPFMNMLRREITGLLEMRADADVAQKFNQSQKISYLSCILKVAKQRTSRFSLAFSGKHPKLLPQRFYLVMEETAPRRTLRHLLHTLFPMLVAFTASFLIILQPDYPHPIPGSDDEVFTLSPEYAYLVVNEKGGYDLYLQGEYKGITRNIHESFADLPVYQSQKEAIQYEN